MTQQNQSLTVMEAGFKIKPGQENEFLSIQAKMVPVGMEQSGFVEVYGGAIVNSTWLYFGVRFATQAQMDAWHNHPRHRAVQGPARSKWWTAVYIRKWRAPVDDDVFGDRIFCETRIARPSPFTANEQAAFVAGLAHLERHGVVPFETLTGQYEAQPYQLAGPLEAAPNQGLALYALFTHWRSHDDVMRWQQSEDYRRIAAAGRVRTEAFIPFVETSARLGLRDDRLQRDWELESA
jgi:heme-degrading monooxygenase HmoA